MSMVANSTPGALRRLLERESTRQVARLAMIGALNTLCFFVLLNVFRLVGLGLIASVSLAFGLSTLGSYVLNRRWTFGLDDSAGGAMETARFYLVNLVAWAVTVTVITAADRLFGPLDRIGENLASLAAAAVTLLPKFWSYRSLVFGKAIRAHRNQRPEAVPPSEARLGRTREPLSGA